MPDPCPLCPPRRPILAENEFWRLVLNENQGTLGRVYLALRRHETNLAALTPDETLALWSLLRQAQRALDLAFAPDYYNYLFHMNLTPHIHMHLYPRYQTSRVFAEQTWTDARYGAHYDPHETHLLDAQTDAALADTLRAALAENGAQT